MRILGLDIGERRIGVALGDPGGTIASPLTIITRSESDLHEILRLAAEHSVERIVVGMPRSLDGSLGRQAELVQAFVDRISRATAIPVETWDERFSTVAAEKALIETGMKREKRKQHRDALAAAFILQGYLDRLRLLSNRDS